jgi:hypothetical protein
VPIPEQPHPSSSVISTPSMKEAPAPPYSSGMWAFINPNSHAFSMIACGQVASRSYSQATGRISLAAKSCASSRSAHCSSVNEKSIIGPSGSRAGPARTRIYSASPEAAVLPVLGLPPSLLRGFGCSSRCSTPLISPRARPAAERPAGVDAASGFRSGRIPRASAGFGRSGRGGERARYPRAGRVHARCVRSLCSALMFGERLALVVAADDPAALGIRFNVDGRRGHACLPNVGDGLGCGRHHPRG